MGVQDGPPLGDLSAQVVAKVRVKARPWKSIILLVLAVGAVGASRWAHSNFHQYFGPGNPVDQIIAAATAVAFLMFASAAILDLSAKTWAVLEPRMGAGHAAVVRYAIVLVGAFTTLIVTLVLFSVPVGQLVVGGALTSVFVGIAAQQALGNVFAGMVLMLARPFAVGDAIRLRAGALSGEIDGTVTAIGITYTQLFTGLGELSIPNSQVLNAVVGPMPSSDFPPLSPPPPPPATVAQAEAMQAEAIQAADAPPPEPGPSQGAAADGSSAGPVGTTDGAGGNPRPGPGGEH